MPENTYPIFCKLHATSLSKSYLVVIGDDLAHREFGKFESEYHLAVLQAELEEVVLSAVVRVKQKAIGIVGFELETDGTVETSLPSRVLHVRFDGAIREERVDREGEEEDEKEEEREEEGGGEATKRHREVGWGDVLFFRLFFFGFRDGFSFCRFQSGIVHNSGVFLLDFVPLRTISVVRDRERNTQT